MDKEFDEFKKILVNEIGKKCLHCNDGCHETDSDMLNCAFNAIIKQLYIEKKKFEGLEKLIDAELINDKSHYENRGLKDGAQTFAKELKQIIRIIK